jgi:hypothetical protein
MWWVAVAGSKKKKKTGSGWNWRLAGIALCAFFALGVITGLSQPGRVLARRIQALIKRLPHSGRSELIPAAYHTFFFREPGAGKFGRSPAGVPAGAPTQAIALLERGNGFYQIDSAGSLLGPVAPTNTADLPVLTGNGVENADAAQLVVYAGRLIRAEAVLSAIISEMRVTSSGEMRLYFDHSHLVIVTGAGQFFLQLAHAAKVLRMWRGHLQLIAMIDMTIPGEAIVQLRDETIERFARATATRAGQVGFTLPDSRDNSGTL